MKWRAHAVALGATLAAVAAGQWLGGHGAVWAWTAAALGAAAAGVALPAPRRALVVLAALASLATGGAALDAVRRGADAACCAAAAGAAPVTDAAGAVDAALDRAVRVARRLAAAGDRAALLAPDARFARLADAAAAAPGDLETGVALLAADGVPLAWAGRHRFMPRPDTAELHVTITPFYATLEARRQTAGAGTAVGTVLLDAAPGIAGRSRAVLERFAADHGVAVTLDPTAAGGAVVRYCAGLCRAGPLVTVVVRAAPPAPGDAAARGARLVAAALALTLILALAAAPSGAPRWTVLAAAAWCVAGVATGRAAALGILFSPATFYQPMLGPFSASAGALAAAAVVVLAAADAWWRRGVPRRPVAFAAAGVLLVAAPYLVRYFGRGIRPPAGGVRLALWVSWEAALALTATALVLAAAALVRGRERPARVPWTLPAACAWAIGAALVGLALWQPYGAWPEWYTFVWLPALVGVVVPAPRRWALASIAVVAGTAAALVTWGAAVEGRIALAQRDVIRLGSAVDPVAAARLARLAGTADSLPPPRSAGALYALWNRSPLASEGYPAVLALWRAGGALEAELRLAAVDLSDPLLAALAASPATARGPRVETLARVPGVHYVLVSRLPTGERLTVGVGPRSEAVPFDRVARFLRGEPAVAAPYTLTISLSAAHEAPTDRLAWRRDGWSARGERLLELPGGVRHAHAIVALGAPAGLAVRGALLVIADVALVALAAALGMLVTGAAPFPRPAPLRALRESYRARLTAALAAFFVVPVLAFALWSFARLTDEARAAGDLLISQTLRDAAVTAAGLPLADSGATQAAVADLAARLDADLWLYQGGVLVGTNAPVLDELGVVDPFLPPDVYRRLALHDALSATADESAAGRAVRVGYDVVATAAPARQAVLAAPELVDDDRVRAQERDLAFTLVLMTLVGIGAAGALAGAAARTLARPVSALREAALAVGRGDQAAPLPAAAPRELAPVVAAFERMAHDVRETQRALEEARRRTARVLASVATGVIAVDPAGAITLANARAAELVGEPLAAGAPLAGAGGGAWAEVWAAVRGFRGDDAAAEREFEIAGRRIRVLLAPLGEAGQGTVVALDDTTDLARAQRVLAWGEMARQVAHEIKNPLTPIRLGIQHLERSRAAGRGFTRAFTETAPRILAEIDRLDAIARAFSRFGAPAASAAPLEAVDLAAVAAEVAALYRLGEGAAEDGAALTRVVVDGRGGTRIRARRDEVKEVLVNLIENARAAGARNVRLVLADGGAELAVADDGPGIPPEALARVFEPSFSTTTSGAGLGLAIVRRLAESWGATVTLASEVGRGTVVTLRAARA